VDVEVDVDVDVDAHADVNVDVAVAVDVTVDVEDVGVDARRETPDATFLERQTRSSHNARVLRKDAINADIDVEVDVDILRFGGSRGFSGSAP